MNTYQDIARQAAKAVYHGDVAIEIADAVLAAVLAEQAKAPPQTPEPPASYKDRAAYRASFNVSAPLAPAVKPEPPLDIAHLLEAADTHLPSDLTLLGDAEWIATHQADYLCARLSAALRAADAARQGAETVNQWLEARCQCQLAEQRAATLREVETGTEELRLTPVAEAIRICQQQGALAAVVIHGTVALDLQVDQAIRKALADWCAARREGK
jgi:hypothetical protein